MVFSSDSLRSILEEDCHDPFRFYEAEIYTYPTKFLTKDIVKLFANEFNVDAYWFSLKLHERDKGETFVKDYKDDLFKYDTKLDKVFAFESFDDGCKTRCYLKVDVKYVEDDVAGKIIYVICFPDVSCLHKKQQLSSVFIKKLIESGNRFGYDYIAYSSSSHNNELVFYVSYESKRQESEIKVEDKLYHVAPLRAKDKILKFGLNPHGTDDSSAENTMKRRHSYRVYLFNGFDMWAIKSFLMQLKSETKNRNDIFLQKLKNEQDSFCVFEVDRNKISHLKLYRDNNFESKDSHHPTALYTYTNIPPNALKFKTELKL